MTGVQTCALPIYTRVAIAGDDAVIRVYNRGNLRLLHKITLPKQTKITAVRLSDDGGRLAVVGEAGKRFAYI